MKNRLIAAAFASGILFSGCAEGTVSSARFVDPVSGVGMDYTLTGAHAFLAEFHRTLHVRFAHREVDFPLEMDTGGYLMMNVYRLPNRTLLLFDGGDYVSVDPQQERVEPIRLPPVGAREFMGCFDWSDGASFAFIPAATRPEKKPVMSDAFASSTPTI